jgi:hypothetical protein
MGTGARGGRHELDWTGFSEHGDEPSDSITTGSLEYELWRQTLHQSVN